eukprot:4599368-Pyramimonas_sp.AAC.1
MASCSAEMLPPSRSNASLAACARQTMTDISKARNSQQLCHRQSPKVASNMFRARSSQDTAKCSTSRKPAIKTAPPPQGGASNSTW